MDQEGVAVGVSGVPETLPGAMKGAMLD